MLIHKMFRNLRRCLNLKYPRNVHLLGGIRRASTKKSYIHNVGKSPLRHCTVGDAIEEAAHKWPGRPAVIDCHTNTTYTFAQLLDQADKLAAAFLEIGLESGDRVGIWAPNSAEWLVSYLACARAGLISVAINPVYAKPEVEYCLKKVDVKALVMPSVYKQTEYYTMLCDIVKELRSSERGQIKSRSLENLKSVIVLGDYNLPGTFNYGDLIHSSSSSRVDQVRRRTQYINPDSGCNMQFTSGTTADPKAALLSHQGIVNNGYFSGLRYEMDTCHQKLCVQVPLFHVFGVIVVCMSSLQHGATIVLPSPTYNANANLEALLMEKCTAVVGTPTMFVDLLTNLNSFNVTANVNWALTGGAPASPMLLENIKKTLGAKSVKSIFGMTEMSGGMFESMPEEPAEKAYETAGRLLDHLEAKIVDEDGCIVPMGEPGELLVRGYCTLIEYWKDAEKTTAAIGKDGWLRTGDQVIISEDGYAKVAGRLKDVIIRGGENIYPKEIEDVIDSHPDVVESQVFGVPDERLGEEVSVAVRLRGGANMNVVTQSLHEFCKGKLAYFKIPRYVRVVEEFPKTTSGKIQRRKLKTLFSPEVDNTPKPCRISNKIYTRRTSVRTRSSYLHKVGCSPLLNDTVGDVIEQAANKWPDRTAITDRYQEKSLNYAELLQQADKLAVAFLESGLRNGDRIGIWCPNMVEWVVSLFAAARAGLISVAINPSYQKSEIEFCLKKVDVKALIIPEAYKTQQYYRMMTEIVPELNSSEAGKVRSKRLDKLETVITIGDKDLPGAFNYEKLIKSANGDTLSSKLTEKVTPESGSNIQFTSGTTGEPKAALLSHKALVNNGFFTGLRNQLDTAALKICAQVPLFHVFGMVVTLLASALHGCNVVLTHPSYSPSKNLEAIFVEKCEVVFGTPTMHVDLMAQLQAKGTQAKTKLVLTGGASCPPILVKNIQKIIGAESVRSIYGLTETSAVCFQSMPDDKSERVTESVGQLHDHLEAKVVNENGETVPFGTPGELYVRGYSIFMKYWDEPVKTASALQKDGWLGTGDQFVLNEDGYGNVVGRIKDLIIRGGENIYPKEIEDLINTHPDVLETQVFGVNDDRLGEEICATVRLREGAMISEKIVEQFCHEKIAAFKIPRFVRTLKEYPKTASGKVQKHKLKEMFESGKI